MTPETTENLLLITPNIQHHYRITGNNLNYVYIPTQMQPGLFYKITMNGTTSSSSDDNFRIFPNSPNTPTSKNYTDLNSQYYRTSPGGSKRTSNKNYYLCDIAGGRKGINPKFEMYIDPQICEMYWFGTSTVGATGLYIGQGHGNKSIPVIWATVGSIYNDGGDRFSEIDVIVEITPKLVKPYNFIDMVLYVNIT
jgi:hypothetical protein